MQYHEGIDLIGHVRTTEPLPVAFGISWAKTLTGTSTSGSKWGWGREKKNPEDTQLLSGNGVSSPCAVVLIVIDKALKTVSLYK